MSNGVEIAGLGHYVPSRRVANAEIEMRLGLEAGWIKRRTGIEARRYAADDEALSDMAVKAGEMALSQSGTKRSDIAMLLLATSTPDHILPPSAPLVAHRLGLKNAGGIDLAGACGGFIYALVLADSFVRTHQAPVLVIAGNILSRRIDVKDRASSILFADAAGAALLAPSARKDAGILGADLKSAGAHYTLISIAGGGSRKPFSAVSDPNETLMVISDGQKVYSEAVAMMTGCARGALQKAGLEASDIDLFIPHQANARMTKTIAHQLAIDERLVAQSIREYGNSSAATIPLTLSMHDQAKKIAPGACVLMTAAGAGMTGGAAVMRW